MLDNRRLTPELNDSVERVQNVPDRGDEEAREFRSTGNLYREGTASGYKQNDCEAVRYFRLAAHGLTDPREKLKVTQDISFIGFDSGGDDIKVLCSLPILLLQKTLTWACQDILKCVNNDGLTEEQKTNWNQILFQVLGGLDEKDQDGRLAMLPANREAFIIKITELLADSNDSQGNGELIRQCIQARINKPRSLFTSVKPLQALLKWAPGKVSEDVSTPSGVFGSMFSRQVGAPPPGVNKGLSDFDL